MGVSTAAATFFRQIGGTLGVAVFLSILFGSSAPTSPTELRTAAQDPAFQQAVAPACTAPTRPTSALADGLPTTTCRRRGAVLNDSSIVQQLSPALAQPFKVGFADSMSTVFLAVTGIALLGLVLVLFWKEVPLRVGGGLAASAAAQREQEASAD